MMEDDKIESFFRNMRAADDHRVVPPFPERKETRRLWPVVLYAAAAAVIAVVVIARYVAPPADQPVMTVVEVDFVVGPDRLQSQSLIEGGEQDLSAWKSPTSSLSEYY